MHKYAIDEYQIIMMKALPVQMKSVLTTVEC